MPDGSSNAFGFRPAVRENTPMVMALAGASGSGKTFTALELAMGLAGDGKIAVIDTEGRRALHYADLQDEASRRLFRFDHCELRPPFEPARFLAAMKTAEDAGYRVIVIDSFSDEHEGEGGLIDMAAAGNSQNTAANWARPKAQHKLVVRWLRQTRCHVIFCLRAEERVRLEKDDKGKTVVVPIGWQPICEKRFMYDMTASFLLSPGAPGIPEPIKLQEQHREFFPSARPITRTSGETLANWAAGGKASPPKIEPSIYERAEQAAERGMVVLERFWRSLGREERLEIRPRMSALKDRAADADTEAAEDDPFAPRPEPAHPNEAPIEDAPADEPRLM